MVLPSDANNLGTVFGGRVRRITARSLFWNDAGLLDDSQVISFARLMAAASSDNHGGRRA